MIMGNFVTGFKEHWFGLWRRQYRFDGFSFSSCSWWWSPCYWVHKSFLYTIFLFCHKIELSNRNQRVGLCLWLLLFLLFYFHCNLYFVMLLSPCRVIPKTLMPREVCLLFYTIFYVALSLYKVSHLFFLFDKKKKILLL